MCVNVDVCLALKYLAMLWKPVMFLDVLLSLFNLILSEKRDEKKRKVKTTTIRVTQQLVASQLNMAVKSHIIAAINSTRKSRESTDSSNEKDLEAYTAPKWTNGATVWLSNRGSIINVRCNGVNRAECDLLVGECQWLENETHLIVGGELCEFWYGCISDCRLLLWWTQWMSHVAINSNTCNTYLGGGGLEYNKRWSERSSAPTDTHFSTHTQMQSDTYTNTKDPWLPCFFSSFSSLICLTLLLPPLPFSDPLLAPRQACLFGSIMSLFRVRRQPNVN